MKAALPLFRVALGARVHSGDCRTGGVHVMGELLYPTGTEVKINTHPPLS